MGRSGFAGALLLLLVAACAVEAAPVAGAPAAGGMRADKYFHPMNDPLAEVDAFDTMTENEKQLYWSEDRGDTVQDKIKQLDDFEVTMSVTLVLVGFDGEGNDALRVDELAFARYFESMKHEEQPRVIHAEKGQPHELALRVKYLYHVEKAPASLATRLQAAVAEAVEGTPNGRIPVGVVDDIISAEYAKSSLSHTFYVLNLAPPTRAVQYSNGDVDTAEPVPYAYYLPQKGDLNGNLADCEFSTFVGREQRYVWTDLTAGPVEFGPQTSGDGIVTRYSMPRLENYVQGKGGESTLQYEWGKRELVADLVAHVRNAVDYVVSPSLDHFPIPDAPEIYVHLFVINDHRGPVDKSFFDWSLIESTLESLSLSGQRIEFGRSAGSFIDCQLCVAAFTHSLKSHTSNVRVGGLRTQVHQYLDSKELHEWLRHFDRNFWGITPEHDDVRVIPIFVFDLAGSDILLLDRFHQAVSFPDMVVAVQTQVSKALVDYRCGGTQVSFDMRDGTRAVLSSILQTVWGVSPTHKRWSPEHNDVVPNHLWAMGHTPFGLFSTSKELSYVQRDSAARNTIFTHMNNTLGEVKEVLSLFAQYGTELDEVLGENDLIEFVRRWNVFEYKLNKATSFLSLHSFNHSLYYLRSMRHEAKALKAIVMKAGNSLHSYLSCEKTRKSYWSLVPGGKWTVFLLGAVALGYVVVKKRPRRKRHARKDF